MMASNGLRLRTRTVWWDGMETAQTLTTRSLGQYMPDKQNFGAVITYVEWVPSEELQDKDYTGENHEC